MEYLILWIINSLLQTLMVKCADTGDPDLTRCQILEARDNYRNCRPRKIKETISFEPPGKTRTSYNDSFLYYGALNRFHCPNLLPSRSDVKESSFLAALKSSDLLCPRKQTWNPCWNFRLSQQSLATGSIKGNSILVPRDPALYSSSSSSSSRLTGNPHAVMYPWSYYARHS